MQTEKTEQTEQIGASIRTRREISVSCIQVFTNSALWTSWSSSPDVGHFEY